MSCRSKTVVVELTALLCLEDHWLLNMAWERFSQVLCVLTMLLQSSIHTLNCDARLPVNVLQQKQFFVYVYANLLSGKTFNETLRIEDDSFANISHAVNTTEDSSSNKTFLVTYSVCENNSLTSRCTFIVDSTLKQVKATFSNTTGGAVCWVESHCLTRSVSSVLLHVSQKVSRSLSLMELSLPGKVLKTIRLDMLYPPNVTRFTVDGHEVSGNHLINDGHSVIVSCSFDKGNPPTDFRLLGANGTTLNFSKTGTESISHSFTARCQDEWPIVACEGNGSPQNRSVSFLVECPPQFVNTTETVLSVTQSDIITLLIKSHTTEVSGCLLTSMSSHDDTTINVTCTVSGRVPEFLLNLHLGQKNNSIHGNWTLSIRNGKGSGNLTLNIVAGPNNSESEKESRENPEPHQPKQESGQMALALGCGTILIVLIVTVVTVFAIKKVRGKKRGARDRTADADRQRNEDDTETMTVNDMYETSGGLHNPNSNSHQNVTSSSPYDDALFFPPRNPQTAKKITVRPPHSEDTLSAQGHGFQDETYVSATDVREKKKTKRTGNSPSGADSNTYVSTSEVRKNKRLKKKGKETAETKDPVFASETVGRPSTSGHANADGLVYGDLDFANKTPSHVVSADRSETEYAHINFTAVVPPPRDYKQKTDRKGKMRTE